MGGAVIRYAFRQREFVLLPAHLPLRVKALQGANTLLWRSKH